MAHISLSVSTGFGSTVKVSKMEPGECMSVDIDTYIAEENLYSRDWITVHGSTHAIRHLAQSMLDALPVSEANA